MSDRYERDAEAMRTAMEIIDEGSHVHPSAEVRRRILEHARAVCAGARVTHGLHRIADGVEQARAASAGAPHPTGSAVSRRPTRTTVAGVVVLAAAIAIAGIGVGLSIDPGPPPPASPAETSESSPPAEPLALRVGAPFPDFAAIDVETGTSVSISDLEGDVVLLNIWATWCPPCETEMPSMDRLYRELGPEDFSVVAISVDQESTSLVRRWVEERGLSFTVLHDRDGRFEDWFRSVGVPESFLIDRDGQLVAREVGPRVWDSAEYGGMVRRLLERSGA